MRDPMATGAAAEPESPCPMMLAAAFGLQQNGDLAGAERGYREVLARDPANADAIHLLGLLSLQQGRPRESLEYLLEALALEPLNPYFLKSLAAAFAELKNPARAIAVLEKALALKPDFGDAFVDLGTILASERRFQEAAACFTKALDLSPARLTALVGLACVLKETRQSEPAARMFSLALRVDPRCAEAHAGLGELFLAQHEYAKALESLTAACTLKPGVPAVMNNLGNAWHELGNLSRAMAVYREALSIAPSEPAIHFNLAGILAAQGDFAGAVEAYSRAAVLKPDYAEAHANKALLQLLLGDYGAGWAEYEWRFKLHDPLQSIDRRTFDRPVWDGAPFPGKTLLLRSEQGAGDMIQFCRYAPLVSARGGKVLLECPPRLCRLLRGAPGIDGTVERRLQPAAAFDLYIPLLSVPGFFTPSLDDIPAPLSYLSAEPELIAQMRPLVPADRLNVGICWQGNSSYKGDASRSIPLHALRPLLELPGVCFYSLQKGEGSKQLQDLPARITPHDLAAGLDNGPDAFIETAAAMHHLDLIISSDTSIAHLAGALGRPVWLLVAQPPEWRWLLNRADSPWYPTMRLFRQHTPGDWASAVAEAESALRARLAGGSKP